MQRYKYKALTPQGRILRGIITAVNENDLYKQLSVSNLELINCKTLSSGTRSIGLPRIFKRVSLRDLIQLFVSLEQMQSAGVPLLDALGDVRDSIDRGAMRDILSEIYRDVTEGNSLSESMAKHPEVFNNLFLSLINA